jgi:hypothetical protein
MLRHVALIRTDISEELTRATWRNMPEDGILYKISFEWKWGYKQSMKLLKSDNHQSSWNLHAV